MNSTAASDATDSVSIVPVPYPASTSITDRVLESLKRACYENPGIASPAKFDTRWQDNALAHALRFSLKSPTHLEIPKAYISNLQSNCKREECLPTNKYHDSNT